MEAMHLELEYVCSRSEGIIMDGDTGLLTKMVEVLVGFGSECKG